MEFRIGNVKYALLYKRFKLLRCVVVSYYYVFL